jgi:flagellar basal body-associated protein FliL
MSHHHQTSTESAGESSIKGRLLLGITVFLLLVAGIFGALWVNGSASATENEDAARSAERTKNLAELQAADTTALTTYGWNDRAKGTVHIPITKAMELVLPSLNQGAANAPVATEAKP